MLHISGIASGVVIAGPVTDVMLDLGIRLEFLVPTVAILSMAAGILAARIIARRR
jgi:hypothetical protein